MKFWNLLNFGSWHLLGVNGFNFIQLARSHPMVQLFGLLSRGRVDCELVAQELDQGDLVIRIAGLPIEACCLRECR